MYNHQLDTFIKVADAGSFNKAAEQLYITSSAVIQQINLLEENLEVRLFERTYRGVKLTRAGQLLYEHAKNMIKYSNETIAKLRKISLEDSHMIRIGTSPTTPIQPLVPLWTKIQAQHQEMRFKVVPFENTRENAKTILSTLEKDIDVIGGIFDKTMLSYRRCDGLELMTMPFCCAMSLNHRLAGKPKLRLEDLYGENLLVMRQGWSLNVDGLRADLSARHPQIHLIDFDFYDTEIFNRCENSNDILLAVPAWEGVHPLLKMVPVEWDYCIPYGILHAKKPSARVQQFLQLAQAYKEEI